MSIINFTVKFDALASLTDSADVGADADVVPLVGTATFTPVFSDEKGVLAPGYSPRPAIFKIRSFVGVVDADGQLKASKGGAVGVRLWANDPVLELENLTYKVDFNLSTTLGEKVFIEGGYFSAPAIDQVINLADVLISTGSPSVSNLNQMDVYAHEIVDSSDLGVALMTAADPASARSSLQLGTGYGAVNVKHYGAVGNGVHDDTAAIDAAWAAAAPRFAIYFPPGDYVYNGAGLDAGEFTGYYPNLSVQGAGKWTTRVLLGSSSYLLKPSWKIAHILLEGITTVGGKGAINQTFTGEDPVGQKVVRDCHFLDYTECAININSLDGPSWYIERCWFTGANFNTIGIATATGLPDENNIVSCNFDRNRVAIKINGEGDSAHIDMCSFNRSSKTNTYGPRIDIWVVPTKDSSTNNSGNGLTITRNKFGAENIASGDHWIVYADELSGSSNGTRMPNLAADSTGYILGHTVAHNFFRRGGVFGASQWEDDYTPSMIYSTTPNVLDLLVTDNQIFDNIDCILKYRTVPTTTAWLNSRNVFGPVVGWGNLGAPPPKVSNDPAAGYTDDPHQVLQGRASVVRQNSSGSSASYEEKLSTAITGFSTYNATITGATDIYGGSDAATVELTGDYGVVFASLSNFTVGKPCWIEIDVQQPANSPLPGLLLRVADTSDSKAHWIRTVEIPAASLGWITFAFTFTPRNIGNDLRLNIQSTSATGSGSTGKVKIGRPRVYQANERAIGGRRQTIASGAADLAATQTLANELRNKLIGAGIIGGIPAVAAGPIVINDDQGKKALEIGAVSSAVNYVQLNNAATTTGPALIAAGSDTNIDLVLAPKNAGNVTIGGSRVATASDLTAPATAAASAKTTPVDADLVPLVDSEASNALKKLSWSNLKAALKSYYDSVTATLSNKSISLGSNTVTGTTAQFNTALTDNDFATLAGTETLTAKTITSPKINSIYDTTNAGKVVDINGYASPANYMTLTNAPTGFAPTLIVDGSDSTVNLGFKLKGTNPQLQVYCPGSTSLMYLNTFNDVGTLVLDILADGGVKINGNPVGSKVAVPAHSNSTGKVGQFAVDNSGLYFVTATDTWVKINIDSTSW